MSNIVSSPASNSNIAIAAVQKVPASALAQADGSVFIMRETGLHYESQPDAKGNTKIVWLAGNFNISFSTRDFFGEQWGRVIEWKDNDGKPHFLVVSMSELASAPAEAWAALASGGLAISSSRPGRDLLSTYIQTLPAHQAARTVNKTGWAPGNRYVMRSGEIIGQDENDIIFYQGDTLAGGSVRGTVEEWRGTVAALARGNSRLMLSIMAGFAAPLLTICGESGGGFHLRGASSVGKTTALRVAASVAGAEVKSWRATGNGLEGVAASYNDALLLLDEINQCAPAEIGETAYMLANGTGKLRASRSGSARQPATWKTLFLSSGEQDLESILSSVKKKTMAGMEIRMLSLPADAGSEMGIFEDLHGRKTPGELAEDITYAASRFFGSAQREWIEFLSDPIVRDHASKAMRNAIDRITSDLLNEGDSGQLRRAARRFAVLCAAGQATTDLTGWSKAEAKDAVVKCFEAWKSCFQPESGGIKEDSQIVDQTVSFIQTHSQTRFQSLSADVQIPSMVRDRVGFRRANDDGEIEYIVFPDAFKKEIAKGFDWRDVSKTLVKAGIMKRFGREFTKKESLPGLGRQRVYILTLSAADDNDVDDKNF